MLDSISLDLCDLNLVDGGVTGRYLLILTLEHVVELDMLLGHLFAESRNIFLCFVNIL